MEGDTVGGVTIMYMAEGLDTGDMILSREMAITDTMTAGEYHDALSVLGAEAICQFLSVETHTRTVQDDSLATYAAKLEKSETEIDFTQNAVTVYNKIRGLSPYPSAFALINGRRFKLINAVLGDGKGEAGSVISATEKG